jgi:hypothetical protein
MIKDNHLITSEDLLTTRDTLLTIMVMLLIRRAREFLKKSILVLMEKYLRYSLLLNSIFKTFKVTLKWILLEIPYSKRKVKDNLLIDKEKELTKGDIIVMILAISLTRKEKLCLIKKFLTKKVRFQKYLGQVYLNLIQRQVCQDL